MSILGAVNPNCGKRFSDHLIEFGRKSEGAYRTLQLAERICKAISRVFANSNPALSTRYAESAKVFGGGTAALCFVRLPEVSRNVWRAMTQWGPGSARMTERVRDTADCAATYLYSLLGLGKTHLKPAAEMCSLVSDTTETGILYSKMTKSGAMARKASDATHATQLKNASVYYSIKLMSKITNVATGIFGMMALALGGPVVALGTVLALGLIGTTTAIWSHFYKEGAQYKIGDELFV